MNNAIQATHITQELKTIPALETLTAEQVERLARIVIRRTYAAGELIFFEGDEATGLWFVLEGRVKIIKHSVNGRVQALCLMNRGKCFGTCPLFQLETNPASAEALDTVILYLVPRPCLDDLMHCDPLLSSVLLHIYSQRLAHLAHLSTTLSTLNVGDRINDTLLTYMEQTATLPVVSLTHEKLADLAGTVREVVTRHLLQLEKQGLIRLESAKITLLQPNELRLPCAGTM